MGETRLVVDRAIRLVVRDTGELDGGHLRGWWFLPGDGRPQVYRIELTANGSTYETSGPDMFDALVSLRRQIEPLGWLIALQGSRLDTYPSGMARDMGGGLKVYVMRPGRAATRADLVATLDDAEVAQLATVDEQRAYWDAWRTLDH
ncbi:hypothetical protein [Prauserella flavalba]|uniref:hypothetical protein n=1 Tax=Prauserella flavalba TaxID=1477506 RepID=UPI001FE51F99|nr:hypothetical protein [Prauserella flavalba]